MHFSSKQWSGLCPCAGSPVYGAEAALKDDEAGRAGTEEAMGWALLAGA